MRGIAGPSGCGATMNTIAKFPRRLGLIVINNLKGPDGELHALLPISIVFTAIRQGDRWFIQDERAHFTVGPSQP
jgi:hypothetical protein